MNLLIIFLANLIFVCYNFNMINIIVKVVAIRLHGYHLKKISKT